MPLTQFPRRLLLAALILLAGSVPLHVSAADALTADQVMTRAEDQFRSLKDYECLMDTDARSGRKTEKGTFRLWYKNPKMLRLRVVRGDHVGSELAVDRNGRIRGRQSGLLKAFVITLKPTDKRLRSVRGVSALELPWGEFYRLYRERASRPGAKASVQPPTSADPAYRLIQVYSDNGKPMRATYRIDARRWILLESELYEDDQRVDHAVFREIKLNTGVRDSWFHF